ncbi:unnamed protein product [Lupinus luteus]|uniref:S-protein homolog n=1 Tax=Lupinus luteus TaxID=3873 RepID=A0AAV1X6E5_LUPLU
MNSLFVNKSVLLLMSLTIFVTFQMMAGVVSGGIFDKTKITITNTLSQPILIHCKDQFNSDGPQYILPGANHRFKFFKSAGLTFIWTCTIQWPGAFHTFDIYDSRRDKCEHKNCYWQITEKGPCDILPKYKDPICLAWNN